MTQKLYCPDGLVSRPLPLHITSVGRFNTLTNIAGMTAEGNFASATWPANNRAIYIPIFMPARFTVARFFVANGTAVSGTFDIGLFNYEGEKLISTGSTAQAGTSVVQYVGVTDQSFPAGNYFLGIVLSTTSGRAFNSSLGAVGDGLMMGATLEALGSAVLPASMAPSSFTSATIPCFGFSQSDTL